MSRPAAGALIRPMMVSDLERVMEIAASLADAPHWPRAAYVASLAPGAPRRRLAIVARSDEIGEVIGFAIANLAPPQAEVESVAVEASAQRRGVGKELMLALRNGLRSAGVTEVTLEVRASNLPALALYRSLGYAKAGRRLGYYADPVEDAVILRLELA
jgi:[ribosomal protein S18]-alanine N-acetyltransferase